jgi:hypothetical protein
MQKLSKWFPIFTVFISGLCLTGYLSIESLNINVRLLVVIFWLALFCSITSICLVRKNKYWPLAASVLAWSILWPTAESAVSWSAWWLNGFGP